MKRTRSTAVLQRPPPPTLYDVADTHGCVALQDLVNLGIAVQHAGEVRDRVERRGRLDPHHEVVGQIAGRAPGPVGHGDEARVQSFQLSDRLEEGLCSLLRPRREELERPRRFGLAIDVTSVHGARW